MSEEINNLLPSARYMNADNVDQHIVLDLPSTRKVLNDLSITDFLDIAQQFDDERQSSEKYRIYGNFNYVSLLRDLNGYTINNIIEIFESKNYNGKNFNFDTFFNIQLVYPSNFIFIKNIDDSQKLYEIKYKLLSKQNIEYQQLKSAYQQNSFSELIWNIIPNKNIDLSNLYTNIDDLNISIPINSISLYITLNDTNRLSVKKLQKTYDLSNIFLNSSTTYGYDKESLTSTDKNLFETELLKLKPNFLYQKEFLNKYEDDIYTFLKLYNIAITANNVKINSKFIRNYLNLIRDSNDILYEPFSNTDLIHGGHVIFNTDDYTWEYSEKIEHKFYIDYNYKNDKFLQSVKEGFNFLDDFKNQYPNHNFTVTNYYIEKDYLKIYFKTNNTNDFEKFTNEYNNLTDKLLKPKRFNEIVFKKDHLLINRKATLNDTKIYLKYNPFIDIKIKEFTTVLQTAEDKNNLSIPDYSIFKNNVYVWRDLLDKGFIEPDTGVGFDYPFINGNTYIDNNLRFYVKIDSSEEFTNILFDSFQSNLSIDYYKFNNNNSLDC